MTNTTPLSAGGNTPAPKRRIGVIGGNLGAMMTVLAATAPKLHDTVIELKPFGSDWPELDRVRLKRSHSHPNRTHSARQRAIKKRRIQAKSASRSRKRNRQ